MKEISSAASLITWPNLLLTVKWPVNQTTEVIAVSVIVQVTVIRTWECVYLFACVKRCELLDVLVSVWADSLLISAEGFKASNTSSWLGTSDILFTSLLFFWTAYPLWGEKKETQQIKCNIHFCSSQDTASKSTVAVVFIVTNAAAEPCVNW